jgi:hypothetical protein
LLRPIALDVSSSWQEARKSRMVGSECEKIVSMRAYTVGERVAV